MACLRDLLPHSASACRGEKRGICEEGRRRSAAGNFCLKRDGLEISGEKAAGANGATAAQLLPKEEEEEEEK
ncbi:hypothetical protein OJAV_G00188380 [Oryzias javanicus]|uniref:Uncharacterized protein n=1 Tax=Oryzias javanicus TaxID=123683 RepID=A0A437C9H8_ORYJA|nr:hypothetical protein OJAV_G00188380 [Oryzias javanicus]